MSFVYIVVYCISSLEGMEIPTYVFNILDIGETNSTTKRINPNGLYSTSRLINYQLVIDLAKKTEAFPLKEKFSETCDSLDLVEPLILVKNLQGVQDSQYASIAAKSEVNFVFSSESLLQNDGKLRRFIRNYSYNTFGVWI